MKPDLLDNNLAKSIFFLLLISCFLLILTASVAAHRINLFAWVEGDTVYVEGKFSGGKRVHAGKITVSDPEGTELLSGITDENGEFSFKVSKKIDLKIVLDTGTGHRAEWTITASEIELPTTEKRTAAKKGLPVKNVLIGIGCIFGLTAIIAYIRSRRKKKMDRENTKI
ncbi:MAG: hypothetical protein KJP06_09575 [Deltaproteobacteria bacterium]|nr:hypothetical protein [Deltaproteobacteria bacterium]